MFQQTCSVDSDSRENCEYCQGAIKIAPAACTAVCLVFRVWERQKHRRPFYPASCRAHAAQKNARQSNLSFE